MTDAARSTSDVDVTVTTDAASRGSLGEGTGLKEVKRLVTEGPATLQIFRANRQCSKDGKLWVFPEKYLEASFEVFLFMLAVCWIITAIWAYDVIDGKPHANRIKDIFRYNNVCVGFDEKPARYAAQPLMALQAYFGIRYASLDTLRADMQKAEGSIEWKAYWVTVTINTVFSGTMLLWGMLLIVPPGGGGVNLNYHFYVYVIFVVVMYLTILANFYEAPPENISRISKWWVSLFGVITLLLMIVGWVGFNGYDYIQCPSDDVLDLVASGNFTELCLQEPTIPISFMSFLDYGWFIMLTFTTYLLPASPPLVLGSVTLSKEVAAPASLPFQADRIVESLGQKIDSVVDTARRASTSVMGGTTSAKKQESMSEMPVAEGHVAGSNAGPARDPDASQAATEPSADQNL